MSTAFDQMKSQLLSDIDTGDADYSPKGSIDEKCREIVELINGQAALVTTRYCAYTHHVYFPDFVCLAFVQLLLWSYIMLRRQEK